MTVNEVIQKLQSMIASGEITGEEIFGTFRQDWAREEYFDESISVSIESNWYNDNRNVVYI